MPIQTIEPRRLYRQIADQLRLLIEAGEFPVGARLPPERDLALKLGVSRPSVREALIALEPRRRAPRHPDTRQPAGNHPRTLDHRRRTCRPGGPQPRARAG
ncbi:hypothetical protein G6F57_019880 [Rhizopus arrhizus]|nr:hypothetical protein G6F57_019880 [Rhizopus arrhizus]